MTADQIITIVSTVMVAIGTIIIAIATWRYTNYSKQNIEILEKQKGIMLVNLLKKEGKNIRSMIIDLAVYDNFVTLVKDLDIGDKDKETVIKDKHVTLIENLKNIIQDFRIIDLLLKKQDDNDIVLILYQDFFGFSESESRIYFETIKTSLQNHPKIFNKKDLGLIKNIFKFIAEKRNFSELLEYIEK